MVTGSKSTILFPFTIKGDPLIDVIITENTRLASGDTLLNLYSAHGVFLALAKEGLDARCIDLMSSVEGGMPVPSVTNFADICCYAVFFGNKVSAFRHMMETRRRKKPPSLIIAFGPFAAAFPDEIISGGLADMVVAYDPEFVIPAVLRKGDKPPVLKNIPNLSFMHQRKVVHTRKHSFQELDKVPFIGPYLYSQGHRPALVLSARGCQYHCVYCDRNALWGGGVRQRSVANVLAEIKELVEGQQVQSIQFLDEDLAADHRRLVALCEGMRRIKGSFSWVCCARVDSVNQKILLLMGRSHCRNVYFGMESASSKVLRRIGKKYERQDIINAVHWAQEAGIKVGVMITIGNPGEEEIDRKLTLSTLKELGGEVSITTNWLVILPGTAFFRKGLREGWFTRKSYFEDEGLVLYHEKSRGDAHG